MTAEKTVLVVGGTGFIGRRLLPALLEKGVQVRSLCRRLLVELPPGVERVAGDLLDPASLEDAFHGIDTAYYLVHSMGAGRNVFAERDRQAARNFVAAGEKAGLRRVIYLGGLGEEGEGLSEHLASRAEVARILRQASFPVTVLRAGVIIGAGSAGYEIIQALVRRLPLMIVPRWVQTRCQPIAIDDVIRYLVGCLLDERTTGEVFDIGGPEILNYKEMMERFAAAAGEVNLYLPVPVLTPRLSSYWVGLMTPVKPSIAMPLIEGLRNEAVCQENRIRELIPFDLTPYDSAIRQALTEAGR